MESGDTYTLTIKGVRFHKEERMMQGAGFGNYASNYVATFKTRTVTVIATTEDNQKGTVGLSIENENN